MAMVPPMASPFPPPLSHEMQLFWAAPKLSAQISQSGPVWPSAQVIVVLPLYASSLERNPNGFAGCVVGDGDLVGAGGGHGGEAAARAREGEGI